jgi:hypothetical protein
MAGSGEAKKESQERQPRKKAKKEGQERRPRKKNGARKTAVPP